MWLIDFEKRNDLLYIILESNFSEISLYFEIQCLDDLKQILVKLMLKSDKPLSSSIIYKDNFSLVKQ